MSPGTVVDSDSHIVEPANMWRDYIDPPYRSRAMFINADDQGLEYLDIDGMMSSGYNGGALGRIAGVEKDPEWVRGTFPLPYAEAANLAPGAAYPEERIKHLDREGVDKTFLFPSLGLGWEAECKDAEISDAYCRAYNRWLVEFCKDHGDQLYPVAHVSVREVELGVSELYRAAKDGMKGAFICPAPVNGIKYGDSYYDPFWASAQELDMPVTLHVIFNPDYIGKHLYPDYPGLGPDFFVESMVFGDPFLSFTNMMTEGVFEKFPGLRISMVEIGCTWIAHWLDFLDFKFSRFGHESILTMKPSEYFKRQCWISAEPTEKALGAIAPIVGTDRFLWGSDWPHPEGHIDPVSKVKSNIADLPESDQRKILGENALELYRIASPTPAAG